MNREVLKQIVKDSLIENYDNFIITNENYLFENINYLSESELEEFENILNEKIDVETGMGGLLKPVFIILIYSGSLFSKVAGKLVKDQQYWHAAISFAPSLSHCYSYNFNNGNSNKYKGGLSFESLDFWKKFNPKSNISVSCVLLQDDKYNKLKDTLNFYLKNKTKTNYDFLNLFRSLIGKKTRDGIKFNLVCSTFVDTILKSVNIDLAGGKRINLVKPDDLKPNHNIEKHFKLFEGKIGDYNISNISNKLDLMINDIKNAFF